MEDAVVMTWPKLPIADSGTPTYLAIRWALDPTVVFAREVTTFYLIVGLTSNTHYGKLLG